jgi:capsid protein
MFQEHILRQGPQNNESAFEQAQDRAIADSIKHQFENITGKHFSGKDK